MPAPAAARGNPRPSARLERAPPSHLRAKAAQTPAGRQDHLDALGLALIGMICVLYIPAGPSLIHNEFVNGPNHVSATLQSVWTAGRYFVALAVAPALLIATSRVHPLARCWPMLPFMLFAAASIIWSASPKLSMLHILNLFAVTTITSILVRWYGLAAFGRGLQIATGLLMIASVLTALLLPKIGVHHAYDLVQPMHAGKWRGVFAHKNVFGEVSVTAIILSFRSLRPETTRWKAFFIVARVCSFVGCVMAGSASAWGGALIAICFFMLMRNRTTANPIAVVGMLLVGGALLQVLSLSQGQIAEALGRDTTLSGRTEIWALGHSMIQQHLLFGSGLGTDGAIFGELAQQQLFSSAVDLHSGYLDVLFNLGLVGAALMIAAVGAAMLRGYAYTQTHAGAERDSAVIFMTLVVAACAIATAEIAPFQALGAGTIGLWTALPALYQLGSRRRRTPVVARPRPVRGARPPRMGAA